MCSYSLVQRGPEYRTEPDSAPCAHSVTQDPYGRVTRQRGQGRHKNKLLCRQAMEMTPLNARTPTSYVPGDGSRQVASLVEGLEDAGQAMHEDVKHIPAHVTLCQHWKPERALVAHPQ